VAINAGFPTRRLLRKNKKLKNELIFAEEGNREDCITKKRKKKRGGSALSIIGSKRIRAKKLNSGLQKSSSQKEGFRKKEKKVS